MKLITAKDVLEHKPCTEWTKKLLNKKLGKGKTLLQILNMRSVSVDDRIWCVVRFLPDKTNRAFAIWCARQFKTNTREITNYIDTIEKYYNGKATKKELDAAYRAANWVANGAANWAAYWAAYRVAYRVTNEAAYRAAYWAAYRVADGTAERQKQIKKLKEFLAIHNAMERKEEK